MTVRTDSTPPTGSVVLYGDCNIITASAVLFAVMDWRVTVISSPESHEAIHKRFDGFRDGSAIKLQSDDSSLPAGIDYKVYCANHGAPSGFESGAPTVIELSGVTHDDGESFWTSCSDLVADMRSGFGMLTRIRIGDDMSSPFLPLGTLPSHFLALHTVYLATATLEAPERPQRLQLSAQEALLSALHFTIGPPQVPPTATPAAQQARPQGPRVGGSFDCKDGSIFVLTPTQDLWQPLVALLWKDEWSDQEWTRDIAGSEEQGKALNEALIDFCATRTRLEIVEALQGVGAPTSYHASAEDVINNPQIQDHGFISKAEDGGLVLGRPYRIVVADRAALQEPSGLVRANQPTKYLPLAGLTVCDMSWWWAGPFCGMCLGLLGATVIKVEGRTKVDQHRLQRPFIDGDSPLYDRSFIHFQSGRNKLSLALNLKHPDGVQAVKDVIAKSDILVSNFQPGLLDRLGLGFKVASELVGARPFVFAAMSGFGATGPWRNFRSFGANLAAFGGLANLTGTAETGPVEIGTPFADPIGGITAATTIAATLRKARVLQAPVYIDLAQFEAQELMFNEGLRLGRQTGNWRVGDLAGTGVYRCEGTDQWIAVSVRESEHLNRLRGLLGLTRSDETPESDKHLEYALTAWALARTKAAAATELRSNGIDATEVLSVGELLQDKSLDASGFWYQVDPEEGYMRMEHGPWRVDGKRSAATGRAPRLGEHNEKVLVDIVGYPVERVRELEEAGVLE